MFDQESRAAGYAFSALICGPGFHDLMLLLETVSAGRRLWSFGHFDTPLRCRDLPAWHGHEKRTCRGPGGRNCPRAPGSFAHAAHPSDLNLFPSLSTSQARFPDSTEAAYVGATELLSDVPIRRCRAVHKKKPVACKHAKLGELELTAKSLMVAPAYEDETHAR